MLKKFFFQVLTSFMGAWLAIVLAGVVAVVLVVALVGSMLSGNAEGVRKNSVLKITLEGVLEEREAGHNINIQLGDLLNGGREKVQTVETLVAAIEEAKSNSDIRCIYLDCKGIGGAPASLHAVREALQDFKQSKKKIFAYADNMTGGDYFLASVADEIALNPAGQVQMHGLGGISLFYKDLFDKIGVEFQAVRVGKGKSAIEPYTSSTMSDVAREQNLTLYTTLWNGMTADMQKSRPALQAGRLDTLISIDLISCRPAKFVLDNKVVTSLEYRHAFEDKIGRYSGHEHGMENVVSPQLLAQKQAAADYNFSADNQVAVVYACGGIDTSVAGSGINSAELTEQIYELVEDKDVKALVLRVNSPGGSAFGSEQIWEALEKFKATGRPFVVSMGDYAASGGYYISSGADRIFADPLTITGSIGIYGLIPNIHGLCEKVGLNPQMVATNPQALFPNFFYSMDERQLAAMQSMVEDGYNLFVKRCSDGRKIPVAKLHEIADGRPVAGTTALKLGLVDELGSLEGAVKYAATRAKLKKWNVVKYPNGKNPLQELLKTLDEQQNAFALMSVTDPQRVLEAVRPLLMEFAGNGALQASMPRIIFSY